MASRLQTSPRTLFWRRDSAGVGWKTPAARQMVPAKEMGDRQSDQKCCFKVGWQILVQGSVGKLSTHRDVPWPNHNKTTNWQPQWGVQFQIGSDDWNHLGTGKKSWQQHVGPSEPGKTSLVSAGVLGCFQLLKVGLDLCWHPKRCTPNTPRETKAGKIDRWRPTDLVACRASAYLSTSYRRPNALWDIVLWVLTAV